MDLYCLEQKRYNIIQWEKIFQGKNIVNSFSSQAHKPASQSNLSDSYQSSYFDSESHALEELQPSQPNQMLQCMTDCLESQMFLVPCLVVMLLLHKKWNANQNLNWYKMRVESFRSVGVHTPPLTKKIQGVLHVSSNQLKQSSNKISCSNSSWQSIFNLAII